MAAVKHPRPARSLFERAEITTKDVVSFVLFYGVFFLGIGVYLWWDTWGRSGGDTEFRMLRVVVIGWLLLFILYARGAIRLRLKEIARRDGITPEVLVSQVEPPIQTNKERVTLLAAIMIASAFGCCGLWWWKYARDGQVTADDISSAKVMAAAWLFLCLIGVVQGISGARNMRRQLEARRRAKKAKRKKKRRGPKLSEEMAGEKSDTQP
jgi:hypothetical protein